jgi:hypothetical protein
VGEEGMGEGDGEGEGESVRLWWSWFIVTGTHNMMEPISS